MRSSPRTVPILASLLLALPGLPVPSVAQEYDAGGFQWHDDATAYRGRDGDVIRGVCPPMVGPDALPGVWGTGVYTDDSGICLAAVHAGALDPARAEFVRFRVLPGRDAYVGSVRNGVASAGYGSWGGSFEILLPDGTPALPGSPPTAATPTAPPPPAPAAASDLQWADTAVEYRGQDGRVVTGRCPPQPGGDVRRTWGTDVYTDDSGLCLAAVHAGALDPARGGTVAIRILPGLDAYVGSERNGVASADYGAWPGSFEVLPGGVAAAPAPPGRDPVPDMEAPRSIGPVHWCLACPRAPERRIDIGFTVPPGVSTVVIRIHNGADDAGGDGAVELMVGAPNGRILLSTRAAGHGWEEFRVPVPGPGQHFVTLRDEDTLTTGEAPGNGGSLKIELE